MALASHSWFARAAAIFTMARPRMMSGYMCSLTPEMSKFSIARADCTP